MFRCFTVCYISAFLLKCILLSLYVLYVKISFFMQCVVVVLVFLVTYIACDSLCFVTARLKCTQ